MPAPKDYGSWEKVANAISSDEEDNIDDEMGDNAIEKKGFTKRERKMAKDLALEQARNSLRPFVLVGLLYDTKIEAVRWSLDLFGKPHFPVLHSSHLYCGLWDGILLNSSPPKTQKLISAGVQTNTYQIFDLNNSDDTLFQFYTYLFANAIGLAKASSLTIQNKDSKFVKPLILPPTSKEDSTKNDDEDESKINVLEYKGDYENSDFLFALQNHLDGEFYKSCTVLFMSQMLCSDELTKRFLLKSIYEFPGLSDLTVLTLPVVRGSLWVKYLGLSTFYLLSNGSTASKAEGERDVTEAQIKILQSAVVSQSLKTVVETFNKIEDILKYRKDNNKTQNGFTFIYNDPKENSKAFSSLDLSFASHAIHVLLPDKVISGEKLKVLTLEDKDVAPQFRRMVEGFRNTLPGKLATTMYTKLRGDSLEVSSARYLETYSDNPRFFISSQTERLKIYKFLMRILFSFPGIYILLNILFYILFDMKGIMKLTFNLLVCSMIAPIIVFFFVFTIGLFIAPTRVKETIHRCYFIYPFSEDSIVCKLLIKLLIDDNHDKNI